ncbi:MAG TPA: molecular chaperone DnaJ [Armatimonadota bacterium]|jgi:molecular chaperone DnaJ
MSNKRDYYEVLGVGREASQDEMKKAYRRLAREHHPDVNRHDDEAEERFKELNEAYECLKDPEKRRKYDQFGHEGANGNYADPGFGGYDMGFGDIFDMFFGGTGRTTGRRSVGEDGSDLRFDLNMTLEEVSTGIEKTLEITKLHTCGTCRGSGAREGSSPQVCSQCHGTGQVEYRRQNSFSMFSSFGACQQCRGQGYVIPDPCPDCQGQGRVRKSGEITVKIPAGVEHGMRVRLRGEGDAGAHGGAPGDLYVVIFVKPHKRYQRRGDDIISEIPISFVQAALGDTISVKGLAGEESLNIRAGTQTGTSFNMRGMGLPNINTGNRGDHQVFVKVATPTKLSDEQKKLLLEFAKSSGQEVNPEEKHGFFEKLLGK